MYCPFCGFNITIREHSTRQGHHTSEGWRCHHCGGTFHLLLWHGNEADSPRVVRVKRL